MISHHICVVGVWLFPFMVKSIDLSRSYVDHGNSFPSRWKLLIGRGYICSRLMGWRVVCDICFNWNYIYVLDDIVSYSKKLPDVIQNLIRKMMSDFDWFIFDSNHLNYDSQAFWSNTLGCFNSSISRRISMLFTEICMCFQINLTSLFIRFLRTNGVWFNSIPHN